MSEKTVSLFTFNELVNVKAIEKARNWYKENVIAYSDQKSDELNEMIRNKLSSVGYDELDDINWSLTHCQGDGVAFYGTIQTILPIAKRLIYPNDYDMIEDIIDECMIEIRVYRNSFGHRYSHHGTMEVEVNYDDSYITQAYGIDKSVEFKRIFDDLGERVKEELAKISKHIEREGYEIVESYYADSYVDEQLNNSTYYFLEDGTQIL